MGITVIQTKVVAANGEDGDTTITPNSAIAAGSTLVLLGTVFETTGSTAVLLNSVTDTSSNTWGTPTNVRSSVTSLPNVFACVAENVAGSTPTITLNWDASSGVRVSFALVEVSGPVTSSGVDKTVTGTSSSALSVSTAATGALTQANNVALLVAGGWFGTPSLPSGWTSIQTQSNGSPNVGCLSCYKVTAATDSITGTVTYNSSASAAALMLVIKEAAAGATLQYKFQLDSSTFTSADTGITGYVWRNSGPDGVLAEKYENLEGDATAGDLIITGVPVDADTGDTITGIFYNSTDTSGIISGTVEEA